MKRVLFVVSVFFLFVFTSCSGFFSNNETGISLRLPGGNKSRAVSVDSKTEYFFTVKCENIKDNIDITKYGKTGDLLLFENLVPGSYTITGEAFSDEERTVLKYKGSVEAEVVFGEVASVVLELKYAGTTEKSDEEPSEPEKIIIIKASNQKASFLKIILMN